MFGSVWFGDGNETLRNLPDIRSQFTAHRTRPRQHTGKGPTCTKPFRMWNILCIPRLAETPMVSPRYTYRQFHSLSHDPVGGHVVVRECVRSHVGCGAVRQTCLTNISKMQKRCK